MVFCGSMSCQGFKSLASPPFPPLHPMERGPGGEARQTPSSKSRGPRPARATTAPLRCIPKARRLKRGAWRLELGAFLLALGSFLPMCAQATSPHLISLLPTGAQRGTEVQVSFVGDRLQDTEEI